MDKQQLFQSGLTLIANFCEHNGLANPQVTTYSSSEWRFTACAYYRPVGIHIALSRCAHPGRAGMSWSWPGYVIDRTPHGVLAHELGHHVDHERSDNKGAYGGDFSSALRRLSGEDKLTNYCPNDWEWFAEMFRLFVTNPELLRAVKPLTYSGIIAAGLKPVVDKSWEHVLEGAPERTLKQAEKKIAEASKRSAKDPSKQGQLPL